MPANVNYLGHVYTRDHNAFNCTPCAVLNISRESMARYGFSPATRVFEAAGAGACLITDDWEGIELFLEPDAEVLVARDGGEVAGTLPTLTPERARRIGAGGTAPRAGRAHLRPPRRRRSSRCSCAALAAWRQVLAMTRARRHRHPRPVHHLVLGQRPRDHLPRPGARAGRARPRRAVPGARQARGTPRTGICRIRRSAGPSSTTASTT